MADILVVDDDQSIATAFEKFLRHEGHTCVLASNAVDGLAAVEARQPALVFMDIRMPGVNGLQALGMLRNRFPDVYVVIMTAHGTSQTSIDAIRAGAFEYVTKPLDLDELRAVIGHALSAKRGRDGAREGGHDGSGDGSTDVADQAVEPRVALVGDSLAMHEVYKLIGRLATTDVPALVLGERGTGKELVVATIHDNSARREQPFVTLDCAILAPDALDAEISALREGTLHLAAVHALPRALQGRLARMVRVDPGRGPARPPVRVIASTDQDLGAAVDAGTFSRELFEILSVITLRLRPLRERREDIPPLVRHFLQRFNDELSRGVSGVDDTTMRRLVEHAWPGNAAELERTLKRACIVTRGEVITLADLGSSLTDGRFEGRQGAESALERAARFALHERLVEKPTGEPSSVYHDIVGIVEAALVSEALTITNNNQVKAADLLGVNRATLRKKADL
jgi:DNA-binding NtrC family response regulator